MNFDFNEIWQGIDNLAKSNGMSVSGLAGKAGLNPTTFNKSKRIASDGRKRWPSTESVNKVLEATGTSALDFLLMATGSDVDYPCRTLPLLRLSEATAKHFFNNGKAINFGEAWDGLDFPEHLDDKTFALEVDDDSLLPVYRKGDRLLLSLSCNIRNNDRVAIGLVSGGVLIKELKRKSAFQLDIAPLSAANETIAIDAREVLWIAKIVWVSQ